MTPTEVFWWGLGGSAAIEVLNAYLGYISRPIKVPEEYSRIGFWIARALLLVVAGGLAVAAGASTKISAAGIGAAAPLILEKMRRGGLGN